ncbi:hypothetical protein LR48_Vigan03g134900 [Vigna angularis]|uniref:Uncharacterized protein n=1 Tax=Phaseolus angularis TaxID=3914 RepID=A0A0L9U5P1_PHAAN|nr:hypothetical protein LR48_Vigan03g134900 [Vigna angularis]
MAWELTSYSIKRGSDQSEAYWPVNVSMVSENCLELREVSNGREKMKVLSEKLEKMKGRASPSRPPAHQTLLLELLLRPVACVHAQKKWWGKGGTFLEVEGGAAALGESGRVPCLQSGAAGEWGIFGSSAEGESCWKNLEGSKLAADLGEVRQRSSGVAAASLRKVDSSEVLGAASSEFCILQNSRPGAPVAPRRPSLWKSRAWHVAPERAMLE